jgi:hypothetical protein
MIAITNVVIFFLVLAVIYPAAITVLALLTWLRKRLAMKAEDRRELLERIDESTDKLKDQLFIIVIVVTFFVIAPFLALLLIFNG